MKIHETMIGYKATDANMMCRGFKFELGKWFKHDGALKLCESGFHFCVHPSGPWAFYSAPGTRIFKVEGREAHVEYEPGSELKVVCREIRFIEEIKIGGDRNTGDGNTGHSNTGECNTGRRNTGNCNTGDRNIGNGNTGDWNTGDGNTGHSNTGDWNIGDGNIGNGNTGDGNTGHKNTGNCNTGNGNTGDGNTGGRNTGDGNTGHKNTGDWNIGDGNTGDGNTGHWNTTNRSCGLFCSVEPCVIVFDEQTKMTMEQFCKKYPEYYALGNKLNSDTLFDYSEFKTIPGWTLEKCKSLHEKMVAARSATNAKGE